MPDPRIRPYNEDMADNAVLPVLFLTTILAIFPLNAADLGKGTPISAAPPLSVVDLEGRSLDFRDRVLVPAGETGATLVVFWGTWCEPCIHEIPVINELEKFYGPKGLRIIGLGLDIGGDTVDSIAAAATRHKIRYPVLYDRDGAVRKAFGISVLPAVTMIGGDGVVQWVGKGLPRDINHRIKAALEPREERAAE